VGENEAVEITNKMQPCNIIYYSKIYWRLSMFRAAYPSSSGASNCICSLWFIYPCDDRPLSILGGLQTQRLQIKFGAPDDERYAARNMWDFNKFWNNKFYYKVASCWLFLLIYTTMHGSMNIKLKKKDKMAV